MSTVASAGAPPGTAVADALLIQLIGAVAVSRSGQVLPVAEVGSRKARTLLALLAVSGGQVPLDRIVAAVWGEAPPRRPAANLATLVSRLRGALGAAAIVGDRTGYRLGDGVLVDLRQGAALVDEAEQRLASVPALALILARKAAGLFGGGLALAEYPEAEWAEPARTSQSLLVRRARHTIATAALEIGDVRAAVDAAEAAIATDAFDELACRMLMRAHRAAGEPARALLAYQHFSGTLATELGVDPGPATRAVYAAILRDTAATRELPRPAR